MTTTEISPDELAVRATKADRLGQRPEWQSDEACDEYKKLLQQVESLLEPKDRKLMNNLDGAVFRFAQRMADVAVIEHGRQILELIAGARYEYPGCDGWSGEMWARAREAHPFLVR
jgi:hypothetical protein